MLFGMQDDNDDILARSLHTHVRACWIHAHTPSQGMHTRMHQAHACLLTLGPHAHLLAGPMHTRLYQVPTPARLWGPSCTLTPGPHTHSVSIHAHTRPMHTCSLQVPPCMHALGLCMPNHTRPPCPLTCRVPMHMCQISALMHAASHVVCSSSYM